MKNRGVTNFVNKIWRLFRGYFTNTNLNLTNSKTLLKKAPFTSTFEVSKQK